MVEVEVGAHKGAEKEAKVGDENKQTRKTQQENGAKPQTEYRYRMT